MLNRLPDTTISRSLRWSILAWLLVFACSQSLASSHVHIDSHSDTHCTLCVQADNTPIVRSGESAKVLAASGCRIILPATEQWIQLAAPSAYLTRGPPQA